MSSSSKPSSLHSSGPDLWQAVEFDVRDFQSWMIERSLGLGLICSALEGSLGLGFTCSEYVFSSIGASLFLFLIFWVGFWILFGLDLILYLIPVLTFATKKWKIFKDLSKQPTFNFVLQIETPCWTLKLDFWYYFFFCGCWGFLCIRLLRNL